MSDDTQPIQCGRCHVDIQVRAESDGEKIAFCPACGEYDTLENALRDAGECFQEQAAEQFQAMLKGTLGNSKSIKYTPGVITKRPHRFIVKL